MKIKWKVSPAPTGPYAGFYDREWPQAFLTDADESLVASILCADEYSAARVKSSKHAPLFLSVVDRSDKHPELKSPFRLKKLQTAYYTLEEAKAGLLAYLKDNIHTLPVNVDTTFLTGKKAVKSDAQENQGTRLIRMKENMPHSRNFPSGVPAFAEGTSLCYVGTQSRSPSEVKVTKVGKKYAYLANGKRFCLTSLQIDTVCGTKPTLYESIAVYEALVAKQNAWAKLRRVVMDKYTVPDGVSAEQLLAFVESLQNV